MHSCQGIDKAIEDLQFHGKPYQRFDWDPNSGQNSLTSRLEYVVTPNN